jgi:hypothetical protein
LGQFTEVYIMLMESAKNSPGADFRSAESLAKVPSP